MLAILSCPCGQSLTLDEPMRLVMSQWIDEHRKCGVKVADVNNLFPDGAPSGKLSPNELYKMQEEVMDRPGNA